MTRRKNFSRFLPLPENRSALLAMEDLAEALRQQRSLLRNITYLHGSAGTGKTHLADNLVAAVSCRGSRSTVQRFDASDLSVPGSGKRPGKIFARSQTHEDAGNDWREPARSADLLVIEDLQHLAPPAVAVLTDVIDGRDAQQLATVFTARVGPQHLSYRGSRFPARLTTRLAAGLVIQLQPLQTASRLALLQEFAQQRQLALAQDILDWLAQHITGGGRLLHGALERIEGLTRTGRRYPDLAAVREHFQADAAVGKPSIDSIAERVGCFFNVDAELLQSRCRLRNILLPRQVSMYLARKLTSLSLEQIGAYFGGRDHTTVLHACRKVEQAMDQDALLSGVVQQIHAELS